MNYRLTQRLSWRHAGNRGIAPVMIWGGIIGLAALAGYPVVSSALSGWALDVFLAITNFFSGIALTAVQQVFLFVGTLAAQLINIFTNLNPFDANTLAPFIWNAFRNIAYVIIIFLSLFTGFLWILGNDGPAKDLLWKLLIVAFIINFSFLIAREIYAVSFVVTNSLAKMFCTEGTLTNFTRITLSGLEHREVVCARVGTAIHTSLLTFLDGSVVEQLSTLGATSLASGETDTSRALYAVIAKLIGITLFAVYSAIMFILAMLFVGRFVLITLLVGLLPLAVIGWATPWHRGKWDQWWGMFLRWTANIPILLLLVLIGFSIISASLAVGTGGQSFSKSLEGLIDPTALGLSKGDVELGGQAQAYVGMIRFIFIAVYYAFVIGVAQSLGGGFASFGLNFAKGSMLALGGVAALGTKEVFKPARNTLSSSLQAVGDRVGGRLGERLSEVGKEMGKAPEEERKKRAEFEVNKLKAKGEPPEKILEAAVQNKKLRADIVAKFTEDHSRDQIISALGKLDPTSRKTLLDDKKVVAAIDKKTEGLASYIKNDDLVNASDKMSAINFSAVSLEAMASTAESLGNKDGFSVIARSAIQLMEPGELKKLGYNSQSLQVLKDLNLLEPNLVEAVRIRDLRGNDLRDAPDEERRKHFIYQGIANSPSFHSLDSLNISAKQLGAMTLPASDIQDDLLTGNIQAARQTLQAYLNANPPETIRKAIEKFIKEQLPK